MTEEIIENPQPKPSKMLDGKLYFVIAGFLITAGAAFLRFYDLSLKPLHHDEGVNGYFLITLFRNGLYHYDPNNYHGPTLYYISLAFTKIFGLETFSIRASMGVFGLLMVMMVLFLRKYIGTIGSLVAALFLALSPGMVFISRYFIHEIFFVFCSLGIVLGILFFIENRKPGIFAIFAMAFLLFVCFLPPVMNAHNIIDGNNQTLIWILRISFLAIESFLVILTMRFLLSWNEGKPIYLLLSSASGALFFATKETAFITIGTFIIAIFCVWLWRKIYVQIFGEIGENELEPVKLGWTKFAENCREANTQYIIAGVVITFTYVFVLFFSSFFSYPGGVVGAFEAYASWTKTGTGDHTQNGYFAFFKWLTKLESPILGLSVIGAIIALIKGRHIFAIFSAFWAFGLFAAYTIIPYKTPWLSLSFVLPMCLLAGYGISQILSSRDVMFKAFAGLLLLIATSILAYQSYDLNFVRYDDDQMPYVYAHTVRGFLPLMDKVEYYAKKSGKGTDATIEIVSPDYWSMPWYTRNYAHANYGGTIVDANSSEMIVAKKGDQDAEVANKYASHYRKVGEYPLRPGVDLVLLVRNDLADPDAKPILYNLTDPAVVDISPDKTKR